MKKKPAHGVTSKPEASITMHFPSDIEGEEEIVIVNVYATHTARTKKTVSAVLHSIADDLDSDE